MNTLKKQDFNLNYTFFRGSKSQLLGREVLEPFQQIVTVKVVQVGEPEIILKCAGKYFKYFECI